MRYGVSIIIPAFNEADTIGETLRVLQEIVCSEDEVIVADGNSTDSSVQAARTAGVRVVSARKGRGNQMAAGAAVAAGDIFWFVHADTRPAADALHKIKEAMADANAAGGNFEIVFEGMSRPARFMTWLYPKLRRIGLAYGDSAIFVRRDVYEDIGGFAQMDLFEDIDLVRRVRRKGRFVTLSTSVTTSSRRFEGKNFAATFALWSSLQVLYWLGADPDRLSRIYARIRPAQPKA